MSRLQRLSLASLVVGLVLAAFIVPWSLSTIRKSTELLKAQQEQLTPAPAPAVQTQVAQSTPPVTMLPAAKAQIEAREAERAARIAAAKVKAAIPAPKPAPKPEPVKPAYSLVPRGSAELVPLDGWVDQPNKNRPGRIRTNLMVRNVKPAEARNVPARAPCLKGVRKPAERIRRPYGWINVPARTIPVSCRE